MAFGRKKKLRVEFFDAKADRLIGYDEIPLKEIPEDFKYDTWVELDGDRWKVVSVAPEKPRKALKSGTLVVHLEIAERRTPIKEAAPVVEVKEAPIFRQPSRADQMPRMSGKREDLRLLEIATWEWRNREMTLASNRSVARDVFAKIEELILLNSTIRDGKTFYTRQYDRYDFFAPLRGSKVTLEMIVTEYFPTSQAIDGLTFMGSDQVADSTFVFNVPSGIVMYGQEFDEVVRYLGIHRPERLMAEQLREDTFKLAEFMQKKGLILVDWPNRQIVDANAEALLDYFLAGFAEDAITAAKETLTNAPVVQPETPVILPVNQSEQASSKEVQEVAAVPLAESNPGMMVGNDYPMLKTPTSEEDTTSAAPETGISESPSILEAAPSDHPESALQDIGVANPQLSEPESSPAELPSTESPLVEGSVSTPVAGVFQNPESHSIPELPPPPVDVDDAVSNQQ